MNFRDLLEPYKENGRTVEGQIRWLNSKFIDRALIDKALLVVFGELEDGKTHKDGNALDQYLLAKAHELQTAELEKQVLELQAFMETFKKKTVSEYVNIQKGSILKRIKSVFKPL